MPSTAIVTGAASGIGLEAAQDLLAKGWTVYGIDISEAALAPAARKLSAPSFHPRPCDLRDAASVAEVMHGIQNDAPHVNALIASAGAIRIGPLAEMSVEDFDTVFGVNVRGLWLTCREAHPMLQNAAANGELARVIILSSISAIRPKIDSGAYSASKAAVSQLTQVLAVEWAADGILVNALAPGTVDTPMIQAASDPTKQGNWRPSGASPLGRIAEAIDVVRVMRFLLSEDAGYVTGTIIPVDGGTRAAFVPPR
jgi:NAD(P)-dependent dehydrogenase (short-subunit alcohol dehydrogenase family)